MRYSAFTLAWNALTGNRIGLRFGAMPRRAIDMTWL